VPEDVLLVVGDAKDRVEEAAVEAELVGVEEPVDVALVVGDVEGLLVCEVDGLVVGVDVAVEVCELVIVVVWDEDGDVVRLDVGVVVWLVVCVLDGVLVGDVGLAGRVGRRQGCGLCRG